MSDVIPTIMALTKQLTLIKSRQLTDGTNQPPNKRRIITGKLTTRAPLTKAPLTTRAPLNLIASLQSTMEDYMTRYIEDDFYAAATLLDPR